MPLGAGEVRAVLLGCLVCSSVEDGQKGGGVGVALLAGQLRGDGGFCWAGAWGRGGKGGRARDPDRRSYGGKVDSDRLCRAQFLASGTSMPEWGSSFPFP